MKQSFRNLHYALLTLDDETGATYEKPERLIGAISGKVSPSSESETQYADDAAFEVDYSLGDIKVDIDLATLSLKAQAVLLGHRYANGIMIKNADDQPPYLALGFMSQRAKNSIELVWLYKGKFALIEDEYSTATNKPERRKPKLSGTFVKRIFDGNWEAVANSADEGFTPTLVDSWFADVYTPALPAPEPEGGEG